LFDSNSWTFAEALGKSGGFNEKRVSDIEPFNPEITRKNAIVEYLDYQIPVT